MKRHPKLLRSVGTLAATVLLLLGAGDHAFMNATAGIDPLEGLNVTAKPNVIFLLDNSSTMRQPINTFSGTPPATGDWQFSKMSLAKSALSSVVSTNVAKASFMLATYKASTTPALNSSSTRFYYTLTDPASPGLLSTTNFNDFSWQDIQAGWNTLYWQEAQGGGTLTNPTITISSSQNNHFYFRELDSMTGSGNSNARGRFCDVSLNSLAGSYQTDAQINALLTSMNALLLSVTGCTEYGGGNPGTTAHNSYRFSWAGTPTYKFTLNVHPAGLTTGSPNQPYQILADTTGILDDLGITTQPSATLSISNAGSSAPASNDYVPTTTTSFTGANVSTTLPPATVDCKASLSPGFFTDGTTLAALLTSAMNVPANHTCTGGTPSNSYLVTFNSSNGQFTFALTVASTNAFAIQWSSTHSNNIAGALGKSGAADTGTTTGTIVSGSPPNLLTYAGASSTVVETTASGTRTTYTLTAGRFFNGQTLNVDVVTGITCSITSGSATNPPTVIIQGVAAGCGSSAGISPLTFTLAGANWGTDSGDSFGVPGGGSCSGSQTAVALAACDSTSQVANFGVGLGAGLSLSTTSPFAPVNYVEKADGGFGVNTSGTVASPSGVIGYASNKPVASAINDLRSYFSSLYSLGSGGLTAISGHKKPHERTILIVITDGDDTCAADLGSGSDNNAKAAAYRAQQLFAPLSGATNSDGTFTSTTDPASSVTTYVVGFGSNVSQTHLNWIAWGGSGMGAQSSASNDGSKWTFTPTTGQRNSCATCVDAYLANTQTALQSTVQSILDTGALAQGTFSAQQTITASVFEYANEVTGGDSLDPDTRYDVLVPILFQASFTMPGFLGSVKAFEGTSAGGSILKWDSGAKLLSLVQNGPAGTNGMSQMTTPTGGATGEGTFSQLHGSLTTEVGIRTSAAGIKRRIYTTAGNGVFYDPTTDSNFGTLLAATSACRMTLWPPLVSPVSGSQCLASTTVAAPASDTTQSVLDTFLGLPDDTTIASSASTVIANLQTNFLACQGTTLPASGNCTAGGVTQAKRMRREAREMILAWIAGAQFSPDSSGNPKRATADGAWGLTGDILYKARPWIQADSTLSSPAVVGPPVQVDPDSAPPNPAPGNTFVAEYDLYRDGLPAGRSGVAAADGVSSGFGLRNPDKNATPAVTTLPRPAMTMVYQGANDMLHAFRAGPNCATPGASNTYSGCTNQGGEEAWAFVPFDRLGVMANLMRAQSRTNKVYVVASPIRFSDVFIEKSYTASVASQTVTGGGVYRQVLYFGRGPGSKYYTAIDVTNRGAFTAQALDSGAPMVWWSRGNPDTVDGTAGGTVNNNTADSTAYAQMGESWAPASIAYVDKTAMTTARVAGGVHEVVYVGSGYSDVSTEGHTFFTLDAVTGDVIAAVDVDAAAAAQSTSVARTSPPFPDALVGGVAVYNPKQLQPGQAGSPDNMTTRVYVADLHGRLWKFVASAPGTAVLMGDLGADQPVGVGPSLIALPAGTSPKPFIFVAAGNDTRASGPFKYFGYRDDANDTSTTAGGRTASSADATVFYYPSQSTSLFVGSFQPDATKPTFKGTIQPATAFSSVNNGRVFFGGTRFNAAGSATAPTPYPCLATFDTIIFAVGAETGGAAYDLSGGAYTIFQNSRKLGIQVIKEPSSASSSAGGRLQLDEGALNAQTVPAPPPPGANPTIISAPPPVLYATTSSVGLLFPQFSDPRVCGQ